MMVVVLANILSRFLIAALVLRLCCINLPVYFSINGNLYFWLHLFSSSLFVFCQGEPGWGGGGRWGAFSVCQDKCLRSAYECV